MAWSSQKSSRSRGAAMVDCAVLIASIALVGAIAIKQFGISINGELTTGVCSQLESGCAEDGGEDKSDYTGHNYVSVTGLGGGLGNSAKGNQFFIGQPINNQNGKFHLVGGGTYGNGTPPSTETRPVETVHGENESFIYSGEE